jgi:uncharacterized protein
MRHMALVTPRAFTNTARNGRKFMSDPDCEARRQANYDLYNRMMAAQNAKDRAGFLDCLDEDILFEAPAYRRDGAPIATGREAMGQMFDTLSQTFTTLNYMLKRFIPAVDPDLVLAEVKGDNEVTANGSRYQNNYLFLVTCRNGRIAHIFEYSNPQVYADTAGAI